MNCIPFDLAGFRVMAVENREEKLTIQAHAERVGAACPECGEVSTHLHSHYVRSPRDLPSSGRATQLRLHVRRFRCRNPECPRKVFCERLPGLVAVSAQSTVRLNQAWSVVGVALGGEAGARHSRRLGMAVSASSLLRGVRRHPLPLSPTPRVLGVDDFAMVRGRVYGTLLVDQESHRPVDMVPERTAEVLTTWLKAHPGVQVITRDRSAEYARGASQGAPTAVQVADRWHVLHNLWEAAATSCEPYRTLLGQIQLEPEGASSQARVPSETPPPAPVKLLNPLAQARQARWEAWQARFTEVHRLHAQGLSHRAIARQLEIGYNTVRKYLRMAIYPKRTAPRQGPRLLDPYRTYLCEQVALGHTRFADLISDLHARGFTGSRSTLRQGIVRCRRELGLPTQHVSGSSHERRPSRTFSLTPRRFTALLLMPSHKRTPQEDAVIAHATSAHPTLAQIVDGLTAFLTLMHQHDSTGLSAWITSIQASAPPALKAFATGLLADWDAVQAAFTLSFSNGRTEGHVNRLKFLKRQMYGRANFDLLRLRVLLAA